MPTSSRAVTERQDLALLTGVRGGEMLRLAYADRAVVTSWRIHQIHHRPGAGVTVGYSVDLRNNRDGSTEDLYVLASTARISSEKVFAAGGRRLRLGETRVSIWEYPFDPELPALELASDPNQISDFLGEVVELELLGYRPTRRAVVRADREGQDPLFIKVLRPKEQVSLEERLNAVAQAGLAAPQIYRSAPGMVVMTAVKGRPLSRLLAETSSRVLPSKRPSFETLEETLNSLEQALDKLPMLMPGKKLRPAWAERSEHYAEAASLALPHRLRECNRIGSEITRRLKRADVGPQVPTHGDFYEANIYVGENNNIFSAILDLDSFGPGYRVHDWGCLLGHMSVLPYLSPKIYDGVPGIVEDWFRLLSQRVDAHALATSASGVVLSLVAGAKKKRRDDNTEAENRLRIAGQWLERA
ncbi:MAG: phosphotransferase [Arcanobacterium sp.]|nr:phosphotransferase [Arcanobacterium sp.]